MATIAEMEETLKIRSWGRWAYWNAYMEVGIKIPAWAKDYRPPWPESPSPQPPYISEEDAASLDNLICFLPEDMRDVLKAIYVHGMTSRQAAASLGKSRHSIEQARDAALNRLYGALAMRA